MSGMQIGGGFAPSSTFTPYTTTAEEEAKSKGGLGMTYQSSQTFMPTNDSPGFGPQT